MWVLSVVCLVLLMKGGTEGQGAPPTIAPGSAAGFDPDCHDELNNCELFDTSQYCGDQYLQWATDNCALTCGICKGPPTTPPPCVDMLDNCDSYGESACTDPMYQKWAEENCRRTCRLCPADVLKVLDSITTTLSPDECVNKVDCRLYPKSTCTGEYAHWAKENCPVYCGLCPGVTTPPKPCVDTLPNCNTYQNDTCTNPEFQIWVEDNCRRYCGKCTAATPPPLPVVNTPAAPPLPGRK